MHKTYALLAAAASLAFSAPVLAEGKSSLKSEATMEKDAKGGMEKHTKDVHKDATGTKTTVETEVDTDVDDDTGTVESEASRTTTTDPKGLLNKTKTEEKVKTVNGKVVESEKKVDGDRVPATPVAPGVTGN